VIGILQDLYLNLILLGPKLDDRQLSAARRSGVVSKLKCLVFLARGENVIASRDTLRLSKFRLTVDKAFIFQNSEWISWKLVGWRLPCRI